MRLFGFMKRSAETFLLELGTTETRTEPRRAWASDEQPWVREFAGEQFHFCVLEMKERGVSLGRFWPSCICVWSPKLRALYHPIPGRHVSPICQNAGGVHSLQQRLLVVLLSSGGPWVYCNLGEGYIGFRANFASTQRWVLNDTKRGVYNKFLHKHFPITYWLLHPRLTSIRSWLPHALKKTSKLTESWRICSRSLECIHQSMKTRRTIPVQVTLIHWRKPRWSRLRIWRLW